MSETPETPTARTSAVRTPSTPVEAPPARRSRLYQAAAWVVIVAGILYIVTTIFFAGFRIAGHHGHHRHGHHHHAMVHPGGPRQGPQGRPGGPGGPVGPGGPSSAVPGPGQPPASIAPSTAPSGR